MLICPECGYRDFEGMDRSAAPFRCPAAGCGGTVGDYVIVRLKPSVRSGGFWEEDNRKLDLRERVPGTAKAEGGD